MLSLLSLATSYLHIRQDLTHAGSSALCFTPVSMLREQGDVFHMRAHSDHVLVLVDKHKIWGQIMTHIGRFSEKLPCSAAFRESTANCIKGSLGSGYLEVCLHLYISIASQKCVLKSVLLIKRI